MYTHSLTNVHYSYFLCSTGPSSQTKIGPDRVVYNSQVVFTINGPFRWTASAQFINDLITLEDDEMVNLDVVIDSPSSGITFNYFPTTVVRIVDNDCRSHIVIPMGVHCFVCGVIGFALVV